MSTFQEPQSTASYMVFTDGTYYYAQNGGTGKIDFGGKGNAGGITGTDASTVIQATLNNLPIPVGYGGGAGKIFLKGTFDVDQIVIPDVFRWIGLTIEGESQYDTVINHIGTNKPLIKVENSSNEYYYVHIRNLRLPASATTGAFPLIDFSHVNRSSVETCALVGHAKTGYGIYLSTLGHYNIFFNNFFTTFATALHNGTGCNANKSIANQVLSSDKAYYTNGQIQFLFSDAEEIDSIGYELDTSANYNEIIGARLENAVLGGTGISVATGAYDNLILGGEIYNFTTKISNLGTRTKIKNHPDYITENSGTAEASNTDTVPFGATFPVAPQSVTITVNESDARYVAQAYNITATGFDLYLYDETADALEVVDKTISWKAEYSP